MPFKFWLNSCAVLLVDILTCWLVTNIYTSGIEMISLQHYEATNVHIRNIFELNPVYFFFWGGERGTLQKFVL